jgi:hypothetical protein
MTGAKRQTSSLSFPSITGGLAARCATAVVALGAAEGGGEEAVCKANMTAATGKSGIVNCPGIEGYSFDGTIRQKVGFVIGWPGRQTRVLP